jgi:hypothetical protein
LVFSACIEGGAGTGWTLKVDKELFYSDIKKSKLSSMRGTLQMILFYVILYVIYYSCWIFLSLIKYHITYVKMYIAGRQYAWLINKRFFSNHQRLNGEHLLNKKYSKGFEQWLVGFTDGDGNFHIAKQKVGENIKWNLSFKLAQSSYNARVLYYIKKELGVGSITKDNDKLQFFIRDRKILESVIIPILDKNPLLSKKYFDYIKLKKALAILNNNDFSKQYKDTQMQNIKDLKPSLDYISPAWSDASLPITNVESLNNVMTKDWLIGFIEAEGSFYLVQKDERIHPVFTVFSYNIHILCSIKHILHIKNKITYDNNVYCLTTSQSRSITNIIKMFKNKFRGMKSLIFKLWEKGFYYKDKNIGKSFKLLNLNKKINLKFYDLQKNSLSLILRTSNTPKDCFFIHRRNYSSNSDFKFPIHTYSNADTDKLRIIKENRNKSGVYRWTNLINGKSYIGSSSNLGERFYRYFSLDYLTKTLSRSKSNIYSSLIKNGYSNFNSLRTEILDYCAKKDIVKKEQYYIDTLKPKYNILKTAYSSLGLKHTEEARIIMSDLALGRVFSKKTRDKLSQANIGKKGFPLKVVNIETNIETDYISINQAAKAFGVHSEKIRRCVLNNKLLFEKYNITFID